MTPLSTTPGRTNGGTGCERPARPSRRQSRRRAPPIRHVEQPEAGRRPRCIVTHRASTPMDSFGDPGRRSVPALGYWLDCSGLNPQNHAWRIGRRWLEHPRAADIRSSRQGYASRSDSTDRPAGPSTPEEPSSDPCLRASIEWAGRESGRRVDRAPLSSPMRPLIAPGTGGFGASLGRLCLRVADPEAGDPSRASWTPSEPYPLIFLPFISSPVRAATRRQRHLDRTGLARRHPHRRLRRLDRHLPSQDQLRPGRSSPQTPPATQRDPRSRSTWSDPGCQRTSRQSVCNREAVTALPRRRARHAEACRDEASWDGIGVEPSHITSRHRPEPDLNNRYPSSIAPGRA